MIVPRLIERKRDGGSVPPDELRDFVFAYARNDVPDYQMAAFLMAVYFQGLDAAETSVLMESMLASGSRLDLSHLPVARMDKHSMGGVGDKTSLVLAPLISSLGVAVPMISGRGLGHTGGTLDKLESIPGFRTGLSLSDTRRQVEEIGCALVGQTDELGYNPIEEPVEVHDLHATLLYLMGMDHTKLTYRFQGRDFRLTDVYGEVVKGILG